MNWRIFSCDSTESTNLDARSGRPGDVFTARFQRAGRGRIGHEWLSPPGANLMMSAVIDVAGVAPEQAATMPLVCGYAVLEGLRNYVRRFSGGQAVDWSLKWPNDVYAGGRKICGILCERHGDMVIAGIGVNVHQREFAPAIADRAVSLALLGLGDGADGEDAVSEVRDAVLAALEDAVAIWRARGFARGVWPLLAGVDYLRGRRLAVLQHDDDRAPVEGVCGGIQSDGSLAVGGECVWAGEAHVLLAAQGKDVP